MLLVFKLSNTKQRVVSGEGVLCKFQLVVFSISDGV
jgi:hypothetical protein